MTNLIVAFAIPRKSLKAVSIYEIHATSKLTHSEQQGSVLGEISWTTHTTNSSTCCSPLVPVIVDLVPLHRISHHLMLVDVWHGA
jgi:hypothetical protein